MRTETIDVPASGGVFRAYLAVPAVTPAPGVIVVQACFGVGGYVRSVTGRLAQAGYLALAPDMYWRIQPGFVSGYTPAEVYHAWTIEEQVSLDGAVEDVEAAGRALSSRPECRRQPPGIVGFCWGGGVAYLAACRLRPACVVAYYGGRIYRFLDEAPRIVCPVLLHFGAEDQSIPLDRVERIREAVQGVPDLEFAVYAGAGHDFSNPDRYIKYDDPRFGYYHEPSARTSWERTLQFLTKHLR